MDTILLIIGVVGVSISGWVLRGYFINTTPGLSSAQKEPAEGEGYQTENDDQQPRRYVTSEEHQLVLTRIAELERGSYSPRVSSVNSFERPESPLSDEMAAREAKKGSSQEETLNSDKWKEIFALQEAYKASREKERDIDYEREGVLFDISQSFDGLRPEAVTASGFSEEEETDQRLLDNQLETGEDLDGYHQRMTTFASLTKEMLVMRLEAADTQVREQQEHHQATLLNIIASLIEKIPGDVNLKSVAQSSFITASTEITDQEGQTNRENFQQMFYKSFG